MVEREWKEYYTTDSHTYAYVITNTSLYVRRYIDYAKKNRKS